MSEYASKLINANGTGTVTLYKTNLTETVKYYARIDRKSVTMENIVARILNKKAGVNENELRLAIMLLRDEILESIEKCESINLFDLGTMYLGLTGTLEDKDSDLSDLKKKVKFTPSALVNERLENITFSKVTYCENEPLIRTVTNLETNETDAVLNPGKVILLTGNNLKLNSDQDKVYFVPAEEDGSLNEDETIWTECGPFYKNTAKNLMFSVPQVEKGSYIIAVKSYSSGTTLRKTALLGYSKVISVE